MKRILLVLPWTLGIASLAIPSLAIAQGPRLMVRSPTGVLSVDSFAKRNGAQSRRLARSRSMRRDETPEELQARQFRQLRVSKRKNRAAVKKVRKLKWHSSLDKAAVAAHVAGKPILWIQALGNLKGYT